MPSFATDAEVVRVVDRGFRAQGATFLEILLDSRLLVLKVQRVVHARRQHPRAEAARRALADAPLEDQLHPVGPPGVEVLAQHFLEEHAAPLRAVEDLGQRELGLQHRHLVAGLRRSLARSLEVFRAITFRTLGTSRGRTNSGSGAERPHERLGATVLAEVEGVQGPVAGRGAAGAGVAQQPAAQGAGLSDTDRCARAG